MYSDTHFHFHYLLRQFGASWGAGLLSALAGRDCLFALDIGTRPDDLLPRMAAAKECLELMEDGEARRRASGLLYFSAGIWPDEQSIRDRASCLASLERQVSEAAGPASPLPGRLVAIGECGLDHHWNPSGADARSLDAWDAAMFSGEAEMFKMQMELAKKLDLPVVVHSREAFEGTRDCIDEAGCSRGIIHCYSYGIDEARAFLDRGFHIALGGAVTYTKKRLLEQMRQLVRFIPEDRLLLETDAPYLAPVPCRGQTNTPLLIDHTYAFVAEARGISVERLCRMVDGNCRSLFRLG